LRLLEMKGALFLHIIWTAGTRMIEQGTNGLSRGDFSNGVLLGRDMLSYVPFNKTALERHDCLEAFIQEWDPAKAQRVLSPRYWCHEAHLEGNCLWAPQPCIADVALEQLCEASHCRPLTTHVFVCAALMTNRWRKQLGKAADVIFHLPIG
jgi:hypothetical protein